MGNCQEIQDAPDKSELRYQDASHRVPGYTIAYAEFLPTQRTRAFIERTISTAVAITRRNLKQSRSTTRDVIVEFVGGQKKCCLCDYKRDFNELKAMLVPNTSHVFEIIVNDEEEFDIIVGIHPPAVYLIFGNVISSSPTDDGMYNLEFDENLQICVVHEPKKRD